jgi:ribonuclease HII
MKVVAGIDEAGLGPTLGPLCFGLAAFRASAAGRPLYGRCEAFVAREPEAAPERLAIDDSKRLFAGRANLAALELAALATCAPRTPRPTTLEELAGGDAGRWPRWYGGAHPPLPVAAEERHVAEWRARWIDELARVGVEPLACLVRPVLEDEFNDSLRSGLNKAEAVLARVGPLLARAAALDPACDCEIRVDRLGGRKFYAPLLLATFPLRALKVVEETEATSRYELRDGARTIRVSFEVEGDGAHLEIALASVVAKYVRELFVDRLNRHFAPRRPGVRPTAGYPLDARRWLDELGDALTDEERVALVRLR